MKNSNCRGIEHIGITVPDIEEAAKFLTDAFGAQKLYDLVTEEDEPMEGAETEEQLGIPKGAKIIHMRLMTLGDGPNLELFQFENCTQDKSVALSDFGLTHFALYVEDINLAAQNFEKAGGKLLSEPHALAGIEEGARNRGVYGKAPWGSLVELITLPDGLQKEELTEKRWKPKQN